MTELHEEPGERSVYELGFHLVPAVPEEKLAEVVSELKGAVLRAGGVVLTEEFPAKTALAYAMVKVAAARREKFESSFFGWMKFEMEPSTLSRLKAELDADERILRYLLVETVKEDTRAPRRMFVREESGSGKIIGKPPRAPEKSAPISEEQLDRSIAELVVE